MRSCACFQNVGGDVVNAPFGETFTVCGIVNGPAVDLDPCRVERVDYLLENTSDMASLTRKVEEMIDKVFDDKKVIDRKV